MNHKLFSTLLFALLIVSFRGKKEKERIVFFGDSITQAAVSKDGYITKLDSIIHAKGKGDHYELIGAGISGNRVEDLYKRLDRDVLSKKPDVVAIWIGVNDVWHKKFVSDSNKIMFSYYYNTILQQLKGKGIKVIMCTPGVIGEKKEMGNDMDIVLNECADSIRAIAKRNKFPLVDLRKDFLKYIRKNNPENKRSGILTGDGVHLSLAGNLFVAERMYRMMKRKVK